MSISPFVKSSGKELVTGMRRQLLLTKPGERVMMPGYGLNLDEFVFNFFHHIHLRELILHYLTFFDTNDDNVP